MKEKKLLLIFILIALLCLSISACGSAAQPEKEKHFIAYPDQYDTTSEGASSLDGACDDSQSKYFVINDFYNMKSEGTLHILSNFETYQQTKEYTCGASSAQMVLNWFDKDLAKKYDELTIAKLSGTDEHKGVSPEGLAAFFDKLGWSTEVNATVDGRFADPGEFEDFVIKNIDAGIPIMVDWIDWSGHWQVIVGIDTCRADTIADDVLILADPYDVSDQWQDGYYTFGACRFFFMWTEGSCTGKDPADIYKQPFVIAKP